MLGLNKSKKETKLAEKMKNQKKSKNKLGFSFNKFLKSKRMAKQKGKFQEIKMTLTEDCNAKCISCLTPTIKDKRYMTESTFQKLIQEIIKNSWGISVVHFYSIGESLLHPKIQDFLDYACPKLHKAGVFTVLTTNAAHERFLTTDFSGLEELIISFNGFDKLDYQLTTGLVWDKVLDNILSYADSDRKARNSRIDILNYSKLPLERISPKLNHVIEYVKTKGIKVRVSEKIDNQCGLLFKSHEERIPCDYITNVLCFNPSGEMILCSHDYHSDWIYGNINEKPLKELIKRKEKDIGIHNIKDFEKIPLCKECNYNTPQNGKIRWL